MNLCRHFGICGGCHLQDLPPGDYRRQKREQVEKALAQVGLDRVRVNEPVLSPEKSRRRAVFKFGKEEDRVVAGFYAQRSHTIVNMEECLVLTEPLLEFAGRLRQSLAPILTNAEKGEVHVSQAANGLDLAFRCRRPITPALTAQIAKAFADAQVVRVIYNGEIVLERAKPEVSFDGIAVFPPPHAFLQATREGEAVLRSHVIAWIKGAKWIGDLFAGVGTFSLPLARHARVRAVEKDGEALAALAGAARRTQGLKPVTTERRDLFKTPLTVIELDQFDAVVLDPPRAGAQAQVKLIAQSRIPRIAYVSCDAVSFARDAAILVNAGLDLGEVIPVDQFLYSDHIELMAGFSR
jgi:23S rRNA (uracil1939-C5)-methyltransferase